MLSRLFHTSRILRNNKIWSEFSKRSGSLGIQSTVTKKAILEGTPLSGQPSLKRKLNRFKYNSPEHIDEIFKISYDFLQSKSAKVYQQIKDTTPPAELEKLLVAAELDNPEVQYNFQFNDKLENNTSIIDYEQPVYRHLGRKYWESHDQMLLMQRLESLAIIPDTMPTLNPKAAVNIKFPFSTGVNKWVEPGEILSSSSTSLPPVFKLQEYDTIDFEKQLYTVLVVNSDVPDLENDTFTTSLVYGLTNIKISYNDNIIDSRKFNDSNIIADYIPPTPDRNTDTQRFSVWVFRQNNSEELLLPIDLDRNDFNIREYAAENQLEPVGAHVWRSEWDSNVESVREKYGMPPGKIFSKVRD